MEAKCVSMNPAAHPLILSGSRFRLTKLGGVENAGETENNPVREESIQHEIYTKYCIRKEKSSTAENNLKYNNISKTCFRKTVSLIL